MGHEDGESEKLDNSQLLPLLILLGIKCNKREILSDVAPMEYDTDKFEDNNENLKDVRRDIEP